jgi:hypothetical protein
MMRRATVQELLAAAKEAAQWIYKAMMPNEVNEAHRRLWRAIKAVETELNDEQPGYLLILEKPNKGRRITATVECGDRYLSRTGWEALGTDVSVIYERKVNSLEKAREELKQRGKSERFTASGMKWTDTDTSTLTKLVDAAADQANGVQAK